MKKILFVVMLLAVAGILLSAQTMDRDFFAVTKHIDLVQTHNMGYKITFMTSTMKWSTFYLPNEWLKKDGTTLPKAEIVRDSSTATPYFTAFYLDGELDHIRVFLHANNGHESWGGFIQSTPDTDALFEIEKLDIQYN